MLPTIQSLKHLTQSLALLDAIICPEWDYRYSSFNSKWSPDEMLASMRNGGGDEYFILFNQHGAILKGFDHESPMSPFANEGESMWPGVLASVPHEFEGFLKEPAFPLEYTTFCIWRRQHDDSWQVGDIEYPEGDVDADGSSWLLFLLDGQPATYQEWAKDYYGEPVDLSAITYIYQQRPVTNEIIKILNPEMSMNELREDIKEIGYPHVARRCCTNEVSE